PSRHLHFSSPDTLHPSFFFSSLPPPPRSTLFPYTTLFRSLRVRGQSIHDSVPADVRRHAVSARTEFRGKRRILRQPVHRGGQRIDRKSTRLNSSHLGISYAVFCLKKKKKDIEQKHRLSHMH